MFAVLRKSCSHQRAVATRKERTDSLFPFCNQQTETKQEGWGSLAFIPAACIGRQHVHGIGVYVAQALMLPPSRATLPNACLDNFLLG